MPTRDRFVIRVSAGSGLRNVSGNTTPAQANSGAPAAGRGAAQAADEFDQSGAYDDSVAGSSGAPVGADDDIPF